jgi:uncharacterized protein (TIGR00730 family)
VDSDRTQRLCVFAGSNAGGRPEYQSAAEDFARIAVARGYGLVFGGGSVGLMGALADAALAAGGEVIGVIPRALAVREVAHSGVTRLEVVASMHERKARMADLSAAFVALPGGIGTLEEILEVFTWAQLGIHAKPCGLLDVDGYWDHLGDMLDHAVAEGFLRPEHRGMLLIDRDAHSLLARLGDYRAPHVSKWLDRDAV